MSGPIPNLSIDRNSFIPFYIQVIESLTEYIENNKFPPGHQLPGEADLCLSFDVSRTVIRQALKGQEEVDDIAFEAARAASEAFLHRWPAGQQHCVLLGAAAYLYAQGPKNGIPVRDALIWQ